MRQANGLHEPGHAHDDGEMPPVEGGDDELVVDVAELRRGSEDAEVKRTDVGVCAGGTKGGWAAHRTSGGRWAARREGGQYA